MNKKKKKKPRRTDISDEQDDSFVCENCLIIPAISQKDKATVHKNDENDDDGSKEWSGCLLALLSTRIIV